MSNVTKRTHRADEEYTVQTAQVIVFAKVILRLTGFQLNINCSC